MEHRGVSIVLSDAQHDALITYVREIVEGIASPSEVELVAVVVRACEPRERNGYLPLEVLVTAPRQSAGYLLGAGGQTAEAIRAVVSAFTRTHGLPPLRVSVQRRFEDAAEGAPAPR